MLKKRIIPCLDIKDGRTVKGVKFLGLRDAGDPVALAKRYVEEGADELVFLDITATLENRNTLVSLVEKIAHEINIPFTVGGGISSLEEARVLIRAGADKVSINSAAVKSPNLIADIAGTLGNQCVVLAVDTKYHGGEWLVYVHGGKSPTTLRTLEWVVKAETLGAGEILLTSMDHDGVQNGFALELTQAVCEIVNLPVIASGGAGTKEHFKTLFQQTNASAALAASIFHFEEIGVPSLKRYLRTENIPIR
jgi:cyclase